MNFINKLFVPSIARSATYFFLAAGSLYTGLQSINMLREEYTECANQYVSTVQSNTNLERIVAIDKHLALYRQNNIKDFVSIQLQDEKEKLLTEQKTRERYELITDLGEKLSAYSRSIQIRGELTGAVTAAFGYVGISTLLNTINKKKNRSGQRNNDER